MDSSSQRLNITRILNKPYELRTLGEHSAVISLVRQAFAELSDSECRNISLCVQVLQLGKGQDMPKQLRALFEIDSSGQLLTAMPHHAEVELQSEKQMVVISSSKLDLCLRLQGSIEDEVKFMHGLRLLKELPRLKLYNVLRNVTAYRYSYGQVVYQEGQTIFDTSGLYLVRKGVFTFSKKSNGPANAELYEFKEGYFFGGEMEANSHLQKQKHHRMMHTFLEEFPKKQPERAVRSMTVTCKSSEGIIYRLTPQFMDSYLNRYCRQVIDCHNLRLSSFLRRQDTKVDRQRKKSPQLLTQTHRRVPSAPLLSLKSTAISSARSTPPVPPLPVPLDISEKPQDYRTLKTARLAREKTSPKALMERRMINPEKIESDQLLWLKAKCQRTRELTRPLVTPPARSEILRSFMDATIKFEKNRRKPILKL